MPDIEHFIYANYQGYGMRLSQSSGVDQTLREESLLYLYGLGKHATEQAEITSKFDTEQVATYTFLAPVYDEHGRQSMWNHTIIVPYRNIISDQQISDFQNKIQKHFIRGLEKPPHNPLPKLRIE